MDVDLVHMVVDGPVVMTERVDYVKFARRRLACGLRRV